MRLGVGLLLIVAVVAAKPMSPSSLVIRTLAAPSGAGAAEPSLAVGPDGAVWLSWLESRPRGGHAFRAAQLPAKGSRWSKPFTIAEGDSFFANWADFPTLLPLAGNRLVAHWPWKSGDDVYAYDVRLSQSRDGGQTWSAPVTPHRDGTATEHGFVSMVPHADGALVVWLDGRDFAEHKKGADHSHHGHDHGTKGDMALRSAVWRDDGTLADERVLDPRVCDCCQTAAVRTTNGGVVVAYRDRSDQEVRDISVVRIEAAGTPAPTPLHADGWTIAGCPVNGPALDAAGDHVAAAWYSAAADKERVSVAFAEDGGRTFGAPIRVDEGAPLGRVDVVLLSERSALVGWLEGASDGKALFRVRRVDRDGGVGPATTVAVTASARSSGFPRMVRSGERLVFAWTEPGKPTRLRTAVTNVR